MRTPTALLGWERREKTPFERQMNLAEARWKTGRLRVMLDKYQKGIKTQLFIYGGGLMEGLDGLRTVISTMHLADYTLLAYVTVQTCQ